MVSTYFWNAVYSIRYAPRGVLSKAHCVQVMFTKRGYPSSEVHQCGLYFRGKHRWGLLENQQGFHLLANNNPIFQRGARAGGVEPPVSRAGLQVYSCGTDTLGRRPKVVWNR